MTYDKNRPVSSIKHNDKRAAIPDSAHQGEEQMAISGMPEQSEYDIFRHEFQRGRDPELYWLNKYKNDDEDNPDYMPQLRTDIRSLYKHEDIRPEAIIDSLYELHEHKSESAKLQLDLFGDFEEEQEDELERLAGYYKHSDNWQNRLIQGDSLLVMNSLLNREGMKGQVQCIYFDPPYGIKYASNWQMTLNSRDVKDNDSNITGEPEMIKAFRDTWELGIHSYLSYLRDRLVMARELLTVSGSLFLQISDENLHLVRSVLDEVFGSENFFAQITFRKSGSLGSSGVTGITDYLLWYAKDIENIKFRPLYEPKPIGTGTSSLYNTVELPDGTRRSMTKEERDKPFLIPSDYKVLTYDKLESSGYTPSCMFDIEIDGVVYKCGKRSWKTNQKGVKRLIELNRVAVPGKGPRYVLYYNDFPYVALTNLWNDTGGATDIQYVCQTSTKVIQRCILMSELSQVNIHSSSD